MSTVIVYALFWLTVWLIGVAAGMVYTRHTTVKRLEFELHYERLERKLYTNLWEQAMKSVRGPHANQ
jgi:hypothetical protein